MLFTHLRPHMDTEQHHSDILASARNHFTGSISIAEDIDVITL